jgi:WD40 repeat protein
VELDKPLEKARHFDHANAAFVAVSPDGRWVATGTWNGFNVKVWEAHTGKLEHTLLEGVPVAAVAFSPDGRWLLTNTEAEVCYWEIGSWRAMRRIGGSGHIFREDAMTFSADGKLLALSSTPGAVQLREPASGRMVAELQAPDANLVGSLSFTPDGGQLVVTSRNDQGIGLVRIWDLRLIRAQLQEIGLDWDLSPYPPLRDVAPARPIQVEVDLGELGRTQK